MSEYKEKDQQSGKVTPSSVVAQRRQSVRARGAAFEDKRPETAQLRGVDPQNHSKAAGRPVTQAKGFNAGKQLKPQEPVQKKENRTGLPDYLKAGVENLSGLAMDDVRVSYNSDKPAQLNAHAYTQGTEIHVGPGQEKHLPHEAWHVVQQKEGRVRPTVQMKGGVAVNDDEGLEKEADVMGERAEYVGRPEMKAIESKPMGPDQITTEPKLNRQGAKQRQINASTQIGSSDKAKKNASMGLEMTERMGRNTSQLKSTRHGSIQLVVTSVQKNEEQILQLSPASTLLAYRTWSLKLKELKEKYEKEKKYKEHITAPATELIKYLKAAAAGKEVREQREILEIINNHAIPKHLEADLQRQLNELKKIAMRESEALSDKEINGDLVVADSQTINDYDDKELLNEVTIKNLKHKELEDRKDKGGGISYTIAQTKFPLFVGRPEIADVQQGQLGDCYLMASLISIVNINPGFIKEMMRDNGDGTVTVRLFDVKREETTEAGGLGKEIFTPRYLKVKKSIVVERTNGFAKYAKGGVWVQMIEKAYAASGNAYNREKAQSAYEQLEGGFGIATLQHIIGKSANELETPEASTINEVLKKLEEDETFEQSRYRTEDELEAIMKTNEIDPERLDRWEKALEKLLTGGELDETSDRILETIKQSQEEIKEILKNVKYNTNNINDIYTKMRTTLRSEGYGHIGKYTPKQLSFYRGIGENIKRGIPMVIATKQKFKNTRTETKGKQGIGGEEKDIEGMYRSHVYAIIGISPQSEGLREKDKEDLHLILVNPHASSVPVYGETLDEHGNRVRKMSTSQDTRRTGGTFKYDLADVETEIDSITVGADPSPRTKESNQTKEILAWITVVIAGIVAGYLTFRMTEGHMTE